MNTEYKKILPEDVYISIVDSKADTAELWRGLPHHFKGNRPTGNDFMDLFAFLVRHYQFRPVDFYAKLMGVEMVHFSSTLIAMSGIEAKEWIRRYTMLSACELLLGTDSGLGEIGRRLGFAKLSSFSHFFYRQTKESPFYWRRRRKVRGAAG